MSAAVLDQPLSRMNRPGAAARDATRAFLTRATRLKAPATDESTDNVLLVVAELVANAIRHTVGPCALHLELLDGSLDVCVTDDSPQPPRPRSPSTDGARGWRWFMVKRLPPASASSRSRKAVRPSARSSHSLQRLRYGSCTNPRQISERYHHGLRHVQDQLTT